MDAYVESLRERVASRGGRVELSELGSVRRPPAVPGSQALKAILQAHPQMFALVRHDGTGWTVHLTQTAQQVQATQTVHRFSDPNMREVFVALLRLHRQYRFTSWPVTRDQASLPAQVLFAMSRGKYVKVVGGTTLTWAHPNIQDCITNMPPDLLALGASAPSGSLPEPRPNSNTPLPTADEPTDAEGYTTASQQPLGSYQLTLVDTDEKLSAFAQMIGALDRPTTIAIDCEGVPEGLDLIQIATSNGAVYVLDCVQISPHRVCECMRDLLASSTVTKLFHDVHKDAYALAVHGRVSDLYGVLDTQLAAEYVWGDVFVGFNTLMQKVGSKPHPTKYAMKAKMASSVSFWKKRPLKKVDVEYAALDVTLLLDALPKVRELLGDHWTVIIEASQERASGAIAHDGVRSIAFDKANDFAIASAELLRMIRPADLYECSPLVTETDHETVVSLLPGDLRGKLQVESSSKLLGGLGSIFFHGDATESIQMDRLSDIVLDMGRRPQCWVDGGRVFISERDDRLVTKGDIEHITSKVGTFGSDCRAGMDGKLHRISAMYNRDERISGLTMRLGRSVRGNADMMVDLLLGSSKSILVLGEPGSGKTTIIREATRILAERHNTIVVDTSNEIAGDGMIPHECIGLARRMMVPSLDQQGAVMVECVQNHTPHVMVIDEIGRPKEVNAARTVKQRGVRMLASAHGDLRKLMKNPELNGLVGGVTSVLMGDAMAKEMAQKRGSNEVHKMKAQRGGEPTFDVVIEVRRGALHEWRVTTDIAKAVDSILEGEEYKVQQRVRDPETGSICLELTRA